MFTAEDIKRIREGNEKKFTASDVKAIRENSYKKNEGTATRAVPSVSTPKTGYEIPAFNNYMENVTLPKMKQQETMAKASASLADGTLSKPSTQPIGSGLNVQQSFQKSIADKTISPALPAMDQYTFATQAPGKKVAKALQGIEEFPENIYHATRAGLAEGAVGSFNAMVRKPLELAKVNASPTTDFFDAIAPGIRKKTQDKLIGLSDKVLEGFESERDDHREAYMDNSGKFGKFIYGGVDSTAAMLPTMAVAVLSGGSTAPAALPALTSPSTAAAAISQLGNNLSKMVPFMTQAGGNYAREAELAGANTTQQVLYGVAGGLAEGLTESMAFPTLTSALGVGEEAMERLIKTGARNGIKQWGGQLLRWAENAVANIGQEVAVNPMVGMAERKIFNPNKPMTGEGGVFSASEAKESAKGAVAMSLVMAALGLPFNYRSHQRAREIIESGTMTNQQALELINTLSGEARRGVSESFGEELSLEAPAQQNTVSQPLQAPSGEPSPAPKVNIPAVAEGPAKPTEAKERLHIDQRTYADTKSKSVNAFQYDNPEVKPFIQEQARTLLGDLQTGVKGERFPVYGEQGEIIRWDGAKRMTSEPIAKLLDMGYDYASIERALNNIIRDAGRENTPVAKAVELAIDDALSEGYRDMTGEIVQPDTGYIATKSTIPGAQPNVLYSAEDLQRMRSESRQGSNLTQTKPSMRKPFSPEEAKSVAIETNKIKSLVAGSKNDIVVFFAKWKNGRKQGEKFERLYLGKISDEAKALIESKMGQPLAAENYSLSSDSMRHFFVNHGDSVKEGLRGQKAIGDEQIASIMDIIEKPDNVEVNFDARRKEKGIVFEKQFPDGGYVYVQFELAGKKTLEGVSLRIKKGPIPMSESAGAAKLSTSETVGLNPYSEAALADGGSGKSAGRTNGSSAASNQTIPQIQPEGNSAADGLFNENLYAVPPAAREAYDELSTRAKELYRQIVSGVSALERADKATGGEHNINAAIQLLRQANGTSNEIMTSALVDSKNKKIGGSYLELIAQIPEKDLALFNEYCQHLHNIDRMSIESKAQSLYIKQINEFVAKYRDLIPNGMTNVYQYLQSQARINGGVYAGVFRELEAINRAHDEAKNKPVMGVDSPEGIRAVTAIESGVKVDLIESEHPEFKRYSEDIQKWWNDFFKAWAVDTGLVSRESYEAMREMYPHYIPTYRVDQRAGAGGFWGRGINKPSVVKKATGSVSEIIPLEEAFAQRIATVVQAARRNDIYQRMYEMARSDPQEALKHGVMAREHGKRQQYYDFADGGELTEADFEDIKKLKGDRYELTTQIFVDDGKGGKALKDIDLNISADIYEGLKFLKDKGLSDGALKMVYNAGKKFTDPIKQVTTGASAPFAARNTLRDLPTYLINTEAGMLRALKNYGIAIMDALSDTDAYRRYEGMAKEKGLKTWDTTMRDQYKSLGGSQSGFYNRESGFKESAGMGPKTKGQRVKKAVQ